MIIGTRELEESQKVQRVVASGATGLYDFYKIKYLSSQFIIETNSAISNAAPSINQVISANQALEGYLQQYVASEFPFDVDYQNNVSYLCYVSAKGVLVSDATYLTATIDVYEVVQSTNNLIVK